MKRKKLMVMIAAVLTVGSFASYKLSQKDTEQDALFLANVEALASDEIVQKCDNYCNYSYSNVCRLITNFGFSIDCINMYQKYNKI